MNSDCIIGLLNDYENTELVTLAELKKSVQSEKEFYEYLKANEGRLVPGMREKPYTMGDYTDFRKRTNLTPFRFCPNCGQVIDWKKIRSEGDV